VVIVFVTGHDLAQVPEGVSRTVRKPIHGHDLLRLVDEVCAHPPARPGSS
jgi:hypothetical protein